MIRDIKKRPCQLLLACLLLSGCGEVSPPIQSTQVWFTPLSTESVEPTRVGEEAGTTEARPGYREIMEGFRSNADVLIQRSDIERRLPQIERVFIQSGHYLELLTIYQRLVDSHGIDNPAADRLVWGYIRLGDPTRARTLLDRLHRRKSRATVWFLEGTYWLQQLESGNSQAGARAAAAWENLLERDSDFTGFGDMSASQIRQQLNRLKQRVSGESVREARAWFEEHYSPGREQDNTVPEQPDTPRQKPRQRGEPKPGEKKSRTSSKVTEPRAGDREAETSEKTRKIKLAKGRIALSEGDYKEAKRIFEGLHQVDADSPRIEFELLKTKWRLNENRSRIEKKLDSLATREGLSDSLRGDLKRFRQMIESSSSN